MESERARKRSIQSSNKTSRKVVDLGTVDKESLELLESLRSEKTLNTSRVKSSASKRASRNFKKASAEAEQREDEVVMGAFARADAEGLQDFLLREMQSNKDLRARFIMRFREVDDASIQTMLDHFHRLVPEGRYDKFDAKSVCGELDKLIEYCASATPELCVKLSVDLAKGILQSMLKRTNDAQLLKRVNYLFSSFIVPWYSQEHVSIKQRCAVLNALGTVLVEDYFDAALFQQLEDLTTCVEELEVLISSTEQAVFGRDDFGSYRDTAPIFIKHVDLLISINEKERARKALVRRSHQSSGQDYILSALEQLGFVDELDSVLNEISDSVFASDCVILLKLRQGIRAEDEDKVLHWMLHVQKKISSPYFRIDPREDAVSVRDDIRALSEGLRYLQEKDSPSLHRISQRFAEIGHFNQHVFRCISTLPDGSYCEVVEHDTREYIARYTERHKNNRHNLGQAASLRCYLYIREGRFAEATALALSNSAALIDNYAALVEEEPDKILSVLQDMAEPQYSIESVADCSQVKEAMLNWYNALSIMGRDLSAWEEVLNEHALNMTGTAEIKKMWRGFMKEMQQKLET